MRVVAIALNSLQRLLRDKAGVFLVFVLPLLLILVLGSAVATFEPRIGVVFVQDGSGLPDDFVSRLEANDAVTVSTFDEVDGAVDMLKRADLEAVVVLPEGYGEALLAGESVEVRYLALDISGFENQGIVSAVVAEQGARVRTARLTASETGMTVADALELATDVATTSTGVTVTTVDGEGAPYRDGSAFSFVAAQELVLFMFLTGMTAAAALIQSRRLGVLRRMLAAPLGETRVLAGVTLGRFVIAAVQAGVIVFATAILFGVEWGSWTATAAVVVAFALVSTASAVLIGSALHNENQSTAVGITAGLALAALGGCMVPLEVFPPGLRTVAHITPHAWAVDAFTEIVQNGAGVADILTELAVLGGFATVLFAIATFMLRRTIVG